MFWIHFISINIFAGGWIVKDSQKFSINKIILGLKLNNIEDLKEKIIKIPNGYLKFHLSEWNIAQRDYELIIKQSFTKDRMDNFIYDIDATKMTSILKSVQGL